jgi:hypothetical protein
MKFSLAQVKKTTKLIYLFLKSNYQYIFSITCVILILILLFLNRNFLTTFSKELFLINKQTFIFLGPILLLFVLIYTNCSKDSKQNILMILAIIFATITFFVSNYTNTFQAAQSFRAHNRVNCSTATMLNTTSSDPNQITIEYVVQPYFDKNIIDYYFNPNLGFTASTTNEILITRNGMELSNYLIETKKNQQLNTEIAANLNVEIQRLANSITTICKYQ